MEVKITTLSTPNPNSLRFIVNKDVKSQGKASFKEAAECPHIPLAASLLQITGVSQIHLFENVVTVTQTGYESWVELGDKVKTVLEKCLPDHDPHFKLPEEVKRESLSPEVARIEEILDRRVRPFLQGDGGNIEILEFRDNIVTVKYEGACGGCPSSTAGTLEGIRAILKEELDPSIEIDSIN